MSGNAKKGLDPLVECSEAADSHEPSDLRAAGDEPSDALNPSTSKSTDGAAAAKLKNDAKRKRTGSRLSLASLFSCSSTGGRERESHRERSRSGWSCGEEPSVVMSSVSAIDLRSTGSGSIGNRRYRGSDAGSCKEEVGDESSEMLLAETDPEEEECTGKKGQRSAVKARECPLCCMRQPHTNFPRLTGCSHRSCRLCLMQYVEMEIMENRVEVTCPECPNHLHPLDIKNLVGGRSGLIEKYEQFSVRRYLLTEPDTRWCPAPDCGYAVIANSCAACPQLKCSRDSCGALFCYHCKGAWHANQTCDEARRLRGALPVPQSTSRFRASMRRRITNGSLDASLKPGDIKACPRCHTYIVKMDDGSCNHMVCAMCSAEFCWLCLKEISDLHYLSPTGCTFWGKKPWTRKKKLLWQVGTLIGAPVGIALIAGISIPGIIFGVPILVGRKVHQRFQHHNKTNRRAVTAACVVGSLVVSPVLAVMAVGVGVPIMLAYVYGVVPLSLCRNGGCGLSESPAEQESDGGEEEDIWGPASGEVAEQARSVDTDRLDGASIAPSGRVYNPRHVKSVPVFNYAEGRQSPNLSTGSGRRVASGRLSPDARCDYEDASVKAMAGSQYHFYYDDKSVHTMYSGHEAVSYCEEVASTKALAGSVHDSKSLSESTGRHRHDAEDPHPFACATPSTSSAEHNKSQIDDPAHATLRHERPKRSVQIVHASAGSSVPHSEPNYAESSSLMEADMHAPSTSRAPFYPSGHYPSMGSQSGAGPSHQDSRDEADPFKIRALLDNMKQMVAADVPQERPYEPTNRAAPLAGRVRRSGSGKSLVTVATHSSAPDVQLLRAETVSVTTSKQKRGFFQSLFHRNKK